MESLISAVLFIIVFGSVLFVAYVTTRFVGSKTNKIMKGKYINIVETVNLGFDCKLHLVKVGSEFVLISTSGKTTRLLTRVRLEEYSNEKSIASTNTFNFKNVFEKYFQGFKHIQEFQGFRPIQGIKGFFAARDNESAVTQKDQTFNKNLERLKDISTGMSLHKTEYGEEYTNENQA
ncbi:MAG TPA: flagellar biosynthetic protein FliO [Acetivibrio sp.]|nr:flagellar biosynthetic protein FliO [Acetivibrio sp.]